METPRSLTPAEREALAASETCWWCLAPEATPVTIAAGCPACAACADALADERPCCNVKRTGRHADDCRTRTEAA